MVGRITKAIREGEEGHALPLLGALVAAAGAVVLSIGAANEEDAVTIVGGIVSAVGLLGWNVLRHVTIDYELFRRTQK